MVTKIALLIASTALAAAQAQTVQVRLLNGYTAAPMANVHITLFLTPIRNQPANLQPVTDPDGIIPRSAQEGDYLVSIADLPRCSRRKSAPGTAPGGYSISEVIHRGIVAENDCSHHRVTPRPGELTLFVRPLHWWDKILAE